MLYPYSNPNVQKVFELIDKYRFSFEGNDTNRFAIALSNVFKKYRVIHHLRDQAEPIITRYIKTQKRILKDIPKGTTKKFADFAIRIDRLQFDLLILFESFFVYSGIFCDEIAHLIPFLFGDANNIEMSGHRILNKNIILFLKAKCLLYNDKIALLSDYIEKEICDFRDKQIVHDFHPRKFDYVNINLESRDVSYSSAGFVGPKPTDKYIVSKGWNELLGKIDEYIFIIFDLIEKNIEKTRFKLKTR